MRIPGAEDKFDPGLSQRTFQAFMDLVVEFRRGSGAGPGLCGKVRGNVRLFSSAAGDLFPGLFGINNVSKKIALLHQIGLRLVEKIRKLI